MKSPKNITVLTPGYAYNIPVYSVNSEGISDVDTRTILFCRGSKTDESIPRQNGIFVESLIAIIVDRLKTVNTGELATRETSIAITKLDEALMWLEKRSNDRRDRQVEGTYQK